LLGAPHTGRRGSLVGLRQGICWFRSSRRGCSSLCKIGDS
jgi:hypothetical protein